MTEVLLDAALDGALAAAAAAPHTFTATTSARFSVPGLDLALTAGGIPKDVRRLLETLRAGMDSGTEGECDAAGTVRRRLELAATPERAAATLHVVDAGERHLVSRDGRRWQACADTTPPAETEAALPRLPAAPVTVTADETAGAATRRLSATLDAGAVRGLVDVRRLLGSGATTAEASGTVTVVLDGPVLEIELAVTITVGGGATGDVVIRSRTTLRRGPRAGDDPIAVPAPSLGLPALASLHQALHLAPAPARRRDARGRRRR